MTEITKLTIEVLAGSIAGIKTPDSFVSDPDMLAEFLNNCDRMMFNAIRDRVVDLRKDSDLQPVHLKCNSCSHEYDQPLNLDMTNFFEPAS